jgi:hypothetical protein
VQQTLPLRLLQRFAVERDVEADPLVLPAHRKGTKTLMAIASFTQSLA